MSLATSVEVERLCDAERTAHFAFDADVAIEVHRDTATEVVVAEARPFVSFPSVKNVPPPGMMLTSTVPGPEAASCADA